MSPANPLEQNPVYLGAMRAHAGAGRPWLVTIEVTNRCNLNCAHCYVVEGRTEKSPQAELAPAEMEDVLEQLRGLGVFLVTFTGGEFFTHPSAFDYLEMATRRAFAIRVFSNLASLPPGELPRLLDYNVFSVETSLHGADAATHDAFTKSRGSFDRMIASVRKLRELEIPVVAKVCWTRHNWRQHREILQLCADLDAEFRGTCLVVSRNDGSTGNLGARMTDGELYEFTMAMHRLKTGPELEHSLLRIDRPEPEKHVCGAARISFRIDPYGNVFPCVEMQAAAGNVRRQGLEDIWAGSETLRAVRAVKQKDFDLNDATPYGPENGSCMLCMGANLKEKGSMTKVAEEPKRIGRVMARARRDYLNETGGSPRHSLPAGPEECAE